MTGKKRAILLGPSVQSLSKIKQILQDIKMDRDCDIIVGIDGGVDVWDKLGYKPHFGVGDWDSLKSKKRLSSLAHITLQKDKDRSDLFFSAVAALNSGADEIVALGVSGGKRADQHLAMLLDCSFISSGDLGLVKSVRVLGEDADYYFLSPRIPRWVGKNLKGRTASLFAMTAKVSGLTLKGFRYTLKNGILIPSSHGMSNVITETSCDVHLRNGRLLVIMPKNG